MWSIIKSFFGGSIAKVGEWLGVLGGIVAIVATIFKQGEKNERANEMQAQMKAEQEGKNVEDKNRANLHDGDASKLLQQDWSR